MLNSANAVRSTDAVSSLSENQTGNEIHRLAGETNLLREKINILEKRLSPLMLTPPGSIGETDSKDSHLVPLASEIRENRYTVEMANYRLGYILENIQI